jgi:hypothetical protein
MRRSLPGFAESALTQLLPHPLLGVGFTDIGHQQDGAYN